jgi:hypothetical protein
VENRDWYTNFRGRVWLHAGKWWSQDEIDCDYDYIINAAIEDGIEMPVPPFKAIRAAGGCIVGSVEITDCVRDHPSSFFEGKYGFVLRDPVALPVPVPFKGALGFFDVPEDLI